MKAWSVIWIDGGSIRRTVVEAYDIYSLASACSAAGVWNISGIIEAKVIPQEAQR